MTARWGRCLAIAALFSVLAPDAFAQPRSIVVMNVTVIDATGRTPQERSSVVVSGEWIVAIGPTTAIQPPSNAVVVDGTGKFIIPGLWDMHVHLGSYTNGSGLLPRLARYG